MPTQVLKTSKSDPRPFEIEFTDTTLIKAIRGGERASELKKLYTEASKNPNVLRIKIINEPNLNLGQPTKDVLRNNANSAERLLHLITRDKEMSPHDSQLLQQSIPAVIDTYKKIKLQKPTGATTIEEQKSILDNAEIQLLALLDKKGFCMPESYIPFITRYRHALPSLALKML